MRLQKHWGYTWYSKQAGARLKLGFAQAFSSDTELVSPNTTCKT